MGCSLLETPCAPVSFRDAWVTMMSRPKVRDWLFNAAPPSTIDLVRSKGNGPLIKSLILEQNTDGGTFSDDTYANTLDDLYVHAYKLRCGTELGFLLNVDFIDIGAPAFAAFDPSFSNPKWTVCRMAAATFGRRLFLFEFCWLINGALTLRFLPMGAPLPSMSPEMKVILPEVLAQEGHRVGNAFGICFCYAFNPADAALLTMAASHEHPEFLAGSLDKLGMSDRIYRCSVYDSAFQSPCQFCLSRGFLVCDCPMPLRRRAATSDSLSNLMAIYVHRDRSVGLWNQFCSAMATSRHKGAYIVNMCVGIREGFGEVLHSGINAFHYKITTDAGTHASIQQILDYSHPSPFSFGMVHTSHGSSSHFAALGSSATPSSDEQIYSGSHFDTSQGVTSYKRLRTTAEVDVTAVAAVDPVNENIPEDTEVQEALDALDSLEELMALPSGGGLFGDTGFEGGAAVESSAVNVGSSLNGVELDTNMKVVEEVRTNSKGDKTKVYPCPICGTEIRSKQSNLKRHIDNKHRNERRFQCDYCAKRFHTRMNLKRHIKTMHERNKDQNGGSCSGGSVATAADAIIAVTGAVQVNDQQNLSQQSLTIL